MNVAVQKRRQIGNRMRIHLPMTENRQKPCAKGYCLRTGKLINRSKWLSRLAVVGVVASVLKTLLGGDSACSERRGRPEATEIFKGITYGCERLEPGEEGS